MNTIQKSLASICALVITLLIANPTIAQPLLGQNNVAAGLSVIGGERLGGSGFGGSFHFEMGDLIQPTVLGNHLGFEFAFEFGYESYGGVDQYVKDSAALESFIFDSSVGFPFTLAEFGDGDPGTTLIIAGLGAGLGTQHVYGYLRAGILTRMSEDTYFSLDGRWTPSEASNDWTERTGLDVYKLRASVFASVGDETDMQFFAEWTQASRTREAKEDPANLAAEPAEETGDFQRTIRVGIGWIF
ncbi:MAG: hypothetical protein ACI9MR_000735 [Myxococcota bacterium]|jgi:hypothetical protein